VLILGIDPGPVESAYCLIDRRYRILATGKVDVGRLIRGLRCSPPAQVAMETIKGYGKRVGAETFETCRAEGRIHQVCQDLRIPCHLYSRMKYGKTLVGDGRVINDTLLRRALLERFGGDKKGEPLCPLKGATDLRSAFAVAAYHIDVTAHERRPANVPLPEALHPV
jgi:hypothetical protein